MEERKKIRKTGKMKTSILHLPEEIVSSEILTKVPAYMLFNSLTYVCKQWRNLICNSDFVHQHFLQSQPGLLIRSSKSCSTYFIEIEERGEINIVDLNLSLRESIEVSSEGFVLKMYPKGLQIVNPINKQCLTLRTYFIYKYIWCNLAFVPSIGQYKVVRAFRRDKIFASEIMTLGGDCDCDHSWRPLNCHPFSKIIQSCLQQPILVTGFLYFRVRSQFYIVSFDVEKETFHETKLPRSRISCKDGYLMEMRGFLAFVHHFSFYQVDVWVLKDFRAGKWEKQHRFVFQCLAQWEWIKGERAFPIGSYRNGEVIVFRKFYGIDFGLYICDTKLQQTRKIKFKFDETDECISHINSMASLQKFATRYTTVGSLS